MATYPGYPNTPPFLPPQRSGSPTFPGGAPGGGPSMSGFGLSDFQQSGIANGIGNVLTGLGQEGRDKASQKQNALTQLSGFKEREAGNRTDMAARAMPYTSPDQTVAPYANLALKRALLGGLNGNPTVSGPAKAQQGRINLPIDYAALQQVGNQYLNDDVLGQAWHQQQSTLNQMNPYGSLMNPNGMFGAPSQGLYDNLNKMRQENIDSYQGSMGAAQQALQQALGETEKKTPWWKTALSMGASVAPYFL